MRHDLVVAKSVRIEVPAAHVWNVLTNPDFIREYLFGTETSTDWQVGSPILFQGTYQGQAYQDKGLVTEYVLHKRLSYRYWSDFSGLADRPENYALVTYEVVANGTEQTLLTWIQQGFATEKRYQHSVQGMASFLHQLKLLAER